MTDLSVYPEIPNNPEHPKTKFPVIQGAMDSEINLLIANLENVKKEMICGFPFYTGLYRNRPVVVQKTFQGMTNAAASTMLAIAHFSPAFIVNQGVCGGHDPAIHRGDIVLGQNIINYANFKIGFTGSGNPVDGCQSIGLEIPPVKNRALEDNISTEGSKVHVFHSDDTLLKVAQGISVPCETTRIFTGTIASADAWIDRKDLMKYIHEAYHTSGEDMESASVAQLCFTYCIPFLSIRALSNSLVNNEEFDEGTTQGLQEFTLKVLEGLL